MACVESIAPLNGDSEMEEGEIVDDLSDISSGEEFLLRQRLEVLENYNNVLERKKAKRSSVGPGKRHKKEDTLSYDLSEISATELEDYCSPYKPVRAPKYQKIHHKQKRKKEEINEVFKNNKDHKRKTRLKKKLEPKVICESSESEDEYRNRRKRLADAVVVNKTKNDSTSLREKLQKMLCAINPEPIKLLFAENNTYTNNNEIKSLPANTDEKALHSELPDAVAEETKSSCEVIDICTDDDSKTIVTVSSVDVVDSVIKHNESGRDIQEILDSGKVTDKDSDDDLELLRQHALKTKTVKTQNVQCINVSVPLDNKVLSDDEDSDTAELRLICLKSALLKKAIEMKRKQKLQKKLSQSSNLQDENLNHVMLTEKMNSENNTDIESVDMDIGSDADEKQKENDGDCAKSTAGQCNVNLEKNIPVLMVTNEDELEEDEDLLRARLLTSLSKNLPNLVNPSVIKSNEEVQDADSITPKDTGGTTPKQSQPSVTVAEEKRFIIEVGSDSEGEHEATKNLTKMHMKLSEQVDFQQKLDMFLKSTRMEVEKTTTSDAVQPKKKEKYVVKAVKNLPKSEQIEYKNLVKRMAELEKIKQARQTTITINNKLSAPAKDTLKPRNVTIDTTNVHAIDNLEEKIKNSRKNIAEESAKMLKLKEEGTKLSQKFKIVATELRNIKTAIALNKKQQRSVQNYLTKIRLHHQMLLKSPLTSTHSKSNAIPHLNHVNPRLQKENNPKDQKNPLTRKEISKENYKNPAMLKAIKIGITNDFKQTKAESKPMPNVIQPTRLSVEVDVANNKKVVTVPDEENTDKNNEIINTSEDVLENTRHSSHPIVEKGGGIKDVPHGLARRDSDDYKSPLDAFGSTTWEEDPNAILCPFEVCGDCKDADCKYLHTKSRSK